MALGAESAHEEGRYQTYLDTTHRREVVEAEKERQAIYAHVGEFVSIWARVDQMLEVGAATWANPSRGGRLQAFMANETVSRKIDLLEQVFPSNWRDGVNLVTHLREANSYRNSIAHWGLAMSGSYGGKAVGWHFYRLQPKTKSRVIDLNTLSAQTLRVHVLSAVTLAIIGPPFIVVEGDPPSDLTDYQNLNVHSVADVVVAAPGTWRNEAHRQAYIAKVRSMFPRS